MTSLELVDGSDEDIGQSCGREILPEPCNLRVEGSDDEDVGLAERPGAGEVARIGPGSAEKFPDPGDDRRGFLGESVDLPSCSTISTCTPGSRPARRRAVVTVSSEWSRPSYDSWETRSHSAGCMRHVRSRK